MNFDPKNFFIGLIDFFSIMLPGAILNYVLLFQESVWSVVFRNHPRLPDGTEGWVVFLLASYLVGHFIFLLSAWLDEGYDRARNATLNHQITHLALRNRLMPRWRRALIWLIFKGERDVAVDRVGRIKRHYLGKIGSASAVNNFQWCKARLATEHPESLTTVQRFEADSKFFRSLVVVIMILVVWWAVDGRVGMALAGLGLCLMALWRYMEQRHKATNQAYWSVITLEGKNGGYHITSETPSEGKPTHAGGVVYRCTGGNIEFLLVQAGKNPREWVLPKGKIELNESPMEAAVREVKEETGVWARICEPSDPEADPGSTVTPDAETTTGKTLHLDDVPLLIDGRKILVRFYLMTALEYTRPIDRWRGRKWLDVTNAEKEATFKESKQLLSKATTHLRGC